MKFQVSVWALFLAMSVAAACASQEDAAKQPTAPTPAAAAVPLPATEPASDPKQLEVVAPNAALAAAAAADDEACAQGVVIAFKGAYQAIDSVTRNKPAALQRANELLVQLMKGGDFAEIARNESDAPNSAARGGTMGTFLKAEWPELHMPLRDPVFALEVGATAPSPIEADYGYTLLRRCPVEKAHGRHVLIRYRGAKKADGDIKRTKEQAASFAAQLLEQIKGGANFDKLARESSDDASRERGGDIGVMGRGMLAPAFETALFGLKPGERSAVVETDFGFHIIERLP